MTLRLAAIVEQLWHTVPGGTARATREILSGLSQDEELEIHGLAGWHGRNHRSHEIQGITTHYVEAHRRVLYEAWLRFGFPSVERETGSVDVVWAASMIVPPTKAPVVATVHDLGFLDSPQHLSRRGKSFFPRAWAGVKAQATTIVCPSSVVADDCVRHGIDAERIRVIPWGVSDPICASDEQADRIRRRLELPERFVLWVGTLEPRKNLTGLVEAMRNLDDDVCLVAVGPKGWELSVNEIFAPLEGRIYRLGWVDDETLSGLYRAATVFVFPSHLEGFGLPVLEAMAHGTPVVTSRGTATEEAAGGAALLVDPSDPSSLTQVVKQVLYDTGLQTTLRESGLLQAQKRSWSASVESYRQVFQEA